MDLHNESFFPFRGITSSFYDESTKLAQDRYEVYVNGDFIGFKTLLTQNDEVSDLNDFLREQGLKAFTAQLDGDHYAIQTDELEEPIKEALHVHLQNR